MEQPAVRARRARPQVDGPATAASACASSRAARASTREFTGYETPEQPTTVGAVDSANGRVLAKLAESPFYAAGGGQISDGGVVECEHGDCRARVAEVFRLGDDQAVALEVASRASCKPGERVRRTRRPRRASRDARPTTPRPTCSTRRCGSALGTHVRQAGSYVGPGQAALRLHPRPALTPGRAARRGGPGQRVDPRQPARARADDLARRGQAPRRDGAVRREVRRRRADGRGGGRQLLARAVRRHPRAPRPRRSALFLLITETSSAANVRRIEALTGPGGDRPAARHDEVLERRPASCGRGPEDGGLADRGAPGRAARRRRRARPAPAADVDALLGAPRPSTAPRCSSPRSSAARQEALLAPLDQLKAKLATRRSWSARARAARPSSWRAWRRRSWSAGSRRATSSASPRRSPAAAAEAATRWPGRAAATPTSLPRPSGRGRRRSRRRWRPDASAGPRPRLRALRGGRLSDPTGMLATPVGVGRAAGDQPRRRPDRGARARARASSCRRRPAALARGRRLGQTAEARAFARIDRAAARGAGRALRRAVHHGDGAAHAGGPTMPEDARAAAVMLTGWLARNVHEARA